MMPSQSCVHRTQLLMIVSDCAIRRDGRKRNQFRRWRKSYHKICAASLLRLRSTSFGPRGWHRSKNMKCETSAAGQVLLKSICLEAQSACDRLLCVERRMQSMHATIITVERLAAIKAVKRDIQAQGGSWSTSNGRLSSRLPNEFRSNFLDTRKWSLPFRACRRAHPD